MFSRAYGFKNANNKKLFSLLNNKHFITYDGKSPIYSNDIKRMIESSDITYWKYRESNKLYFSYIYFEIVGYHNFFGFYLFTLESDEDSVIKFSSNFL